MTTLPPVGKQALDDLIVHAFPNRLNLNLMLLFVGSNNRSEKYPWFRVWCIKP